MVGWGPVGIGYVRPVQFLDHLTVIKTAENIGKHLKSSDIILRTTEDPS